MSGDDGLRELRYLTTCRCDEAWTGRGLHETHCASEYAEDVEAVADEVAALRAKADAADRVRALVEQIDTPGPLPNLTSFARGVAAGYTRSAALIRTALDGPPC